jgi:hypothetical protein
MRLRKTVVGLMLIGLPLLVWAHEIYVSITTIRYQPETRRLVVRVRIFTDNLDEALRHHFGQPANLNTPKESPQADSLIAGYVREQLQLFADGQPVNLQWVKKQYDADVTETYWQSDSLTQPKQLVVENRILIDVIEAQTNIVRVRIGDSKKQYNFDAAITKEIIALNED